MRAFATKTFQLEAPDKDGVSYRTILEGLIQRSKNPEARAEYESELACPPFPLSLNHIWTAFCRLNARRGSSFSINPISWGDIDAFVRLTGTVLLPWEVRLIEQLDDIFRTEYSKPKG